MTRFVRLPGRCEMTRKYFGTDGIRGRANAKITPDLALKVGQAAGIAFQRGEYRHPSQKFEARSPLEPMPCIDQHPDEWAGVLRTVRLRAASGGTPGSVPDLWLPAWSIQLAG